MECLNFTNTLRVGRCGSSIWLGTATTSGDEMLLVTYYLNGDEVSDFFTPIIDGNDIYLDLSDPYKDYYSPFNTYYVSLTDVGGYLSSGSQITNNGTTNDGFIIHFSDAKNAIDRVIPV